MGWEYGMVCGFQYEMEYAKGRGCDSVYGLVFDLPCGMAYDSVTECVTQYATEYDSMYD